MTTNDDIRKMVERFFDGETTLEEEKKLYAYFASQEVDSTLLPYKKMFCDFYALPFDKSTNLEVNKTTILKTDKTVIQEADKTATSRPIPLQTNPEKNDKQESFPILKKTYITGIGQQRQPSSWQCASLVPLLIVLTGTKFSSTGTKAVT